MRKILPLPQSQLPTSNVGPKRVSRLKIKKIPFLIWKATHLSWTTENNKAKSAALKPENRHEEWVSALTQVGIWDSSLGCDRPQLWSSWDSMMLSEQGLWAPGLETGLKQTRVSFFAFWRGTRKKAKIFSIQILIFLDSSFGKTLEPVGPRFLVVFIWITENRF